MEVWTKNCLSLKYGLQASIQRGGKDWGCLVQWGCTKNVGAMSGPLKFGAPPLENSFKQGHHVKTMQNNYNLLKIICALMDIRLEDRTKLGLNLGG